MERSWSNTYLSEAPLVLHEMSGVCVDTTYKKGEVNTTYKKGEVNTTCKKGEVNTTYKGEVNTTLWGTKPVPTFPKESG